MYVFMLSMYINRSSQEHFTLTGSSPLLLWKMLRESQTNVLDSLRAASKLPLSINHDIALHTDTHRHKNRNALKETAVSYG